ncbi:MAG: 2-amino-4-hydroxy-6-hydroxymethyldihydropteridine diphosphokinase [Novosphingobium sp.]
MRHSRHGRPRGVVGAALAALGKAGLRVVSASPVLTTAPLGPSRRRYANAAALVETALAPDALLAALKRIEHDFGRQVRGPRWGARVLDLDIVLWSGGCRASDPLTVPHPAFRHRDFVLKPASVIAPDWRDPLTRLTIRHLRARLTRPRPRS